MTLRYNDTAILCHYDAILLPCDKSFVENRKTIFNKMLGVCPILGCFGTARAQKQSNDTYGVSDSLVLVSYSSQTLLVLARTWVQMSESQ